MNKAINHNIHFLKSVWSKIQFGVWFEAAAMGFPDLEVWLCVTFLAAMYSKSLAMRSVFAMCIWFILCIYLLCQLALSGGSTEYKQHAFLLPSLKKKKTQHLAYSAWGIIWAELFCIMLLIFLNNFLLLGSAALPMLAVLINTWCDWFEIFPNLVKCFVNARKCCTKKVL